MKELAQIRGAELATIACIMSLPTEVVEVLVVVNI
jgi:hypothetical protein